MIRLLIAFGLAVSPAGAQQVIDLNCMEALVSIKQPELAGVFSFIPAADTAHAFADLIVRDRKAMKLFLNKASDDLKKTQGVSVWDHEVLMSAISLYGSPLASTFPEPGRKLKSRLTELSLAPTLSLQEISARRKR